MSGSIFDLALLDVSNQSPPFSDPIVGTDNTIVSIVFVNGSRKLLGIGSTEYGELGGVSTTPPASSTFLSINNNIGFSPYESNIRIIAGGQNMFGFIYQNNGIVVEDEIYTWGRNHKYQLGRGGKDSSDSNIITQQSGPGRVDISNVTFTGNDRIRTYQMGWEHAHATTQNNRVFSWGDNFYGQLGLSAGISDASISGIEPQEIDLSLGGDTPYAVYGGKSFSVVLTNQRNVYAYGINDHLQLGISDGGTTDLCETPIQIDISDVNHVSVGEAFTVVVRGDGTVWGWGDDRHGQISSVATTGSQRDIAVPTQITSVSDAVYATAGKNHTAILRSNGTITLTGDNTYNQVSQPENNVNLIFGLAVANNTFYVELDDDVYVYGAGTNDGSALLGNGNDTTDPANPIYITPSTNGTQTNADIRVLYNNILVLEYQLIPVSKPADPLLKYDDDFILSSSEYLDQKKAICFVKDLARTTDSVISDADACCPPGVNTKPIIRFRSFKEQMEYERGLLILNKTCLLKSS